MRNAASLLLSVHYRFGLFLVIILSVLCLPLPTVAQGPIFQMIEFGDVCQDGISYTFEYNPARPNDAHGWRIAGSDSGTPILAEWISEPGESFSGKIIIEGDFSAYSTVYEFEVWIFGGFEVPTQPVLLTVEDCLYATMPTGGLTPGGWGPPCTNLFDGRLNDSQTYDCAAPVAIYWDADTAMLDVYGVHPDDGDGHLLISLSQAQIDASGLPVDTPILLGSAVNPYSGASVSLYRLPSGEYQLSTTYPDGKAYVFVWDGDGNYHHLAA